MSRKSLLRAVWALSLLWTCLLPQARSQTTVYSSNGYQVNIEILGLDLVPNGAPPCPWGYTYNIRVHYNVTFTGTNPPASMYTLQGTVGCGSDTHFFNLPNGPSSGTAMAANGWRAQTDCETATAASIGCNTVTIQIQGPYLPNQNVNIDATNLPITLLNFEADQKREGVQLAWATASEKDNDYFTVERSADAEHFTPVLRMDGAGNSEHMLHYSAIDPDPLPGTSYYRLRQTDYNGTTTVSHVVPVMTDGRERTFTVFPNPAQTSTIQLPPGSEGQVLQVYSMQGDLLHRQTIEGATVHLPDAPAGTYLLVRSDPETGQQKHTRWVRH